LLKVACSGPGVSRTATSRLRVRYCTNWTTAPTVYSLFANHSYSFRIFAAILVDRLNNRYIVPVKTVEFAEGMAIHAVFAVLVIIATSAAQEVVVEPYQFDQYDAGVYAPDTYKPDYYQPDPYAPAHHVPGVPEHDHYIPGSVPDAGGYGADTGYGYDNDLLKKLRQRVLSSIADKKAKLDSILDWHELTLIDIDKISTLVTAWCRSKLFLFGFWYSFGSRLFVTHVTFATVCETVSCVVMKLSGQIRNGTTKMLLQLG